MRVCQCASKIGKPRFPLGPCAGRPGMGGERTQVVLCCVCASVRVSQVNLGCPEVLAQVALVWGERTYVVLQLRVCQCASEACKLRWSCFCAYQCARACVCCSGIISLLLEAVLLCNLSSLAISETQTLSDVSVCVDVSWSLHSRLGARVNYNFLRVAERNVGISIPLLPLESLM